MCSDAVAGSDGVGIITDAADALVALTVLIAVDSSMLIATTDGVIATPSMRLIE